MTGSMRWDFAVRAIIAACTIGALFLPFSEIALGSQTSLATLSGWTLAIYLPLPILAILALVSPAIPKLERYGPLLDSLTALLALGLIMVLAVYLILAGLGMIAIFFLFFALLMPLFLGSGMTVQAGSWLLMAAFVLSLIQMVRSNSSRKVT